MAGRPVKLAEWGREIGLGMLLRKDAPSKPEVPTGGARRQIEGFAVAIAMALILKQFTFDTFQVPTESMEPTIIGRGDMGDRLLVDRFAYMGCDPERYDIVVFKYPLSRLVNYVKRAVGLPGERILLFHGQIYAAQDGGRDFRITRKPDGVMAAIFQSNPVIPPGDAVDLDSAKFFKHWDVKGPAPEFRGREQGVFLTSGASGEMMVTTKEAIRDDRHDPKAEGAKGTAGGREYVGDVLVSVDVTPAGCDLVALEINDPVEPNQPIRFECAVQGRSATTVLKRGAQEFLTAEMANVRIPDGKRSRIDFQNADDRLVVRIDGEEVARADYDVTPVDSPAFERPSSVRVGVKRGSAAFSRLALFRDLHYTRFDPHTSEFLVPAEPPSYFMLGDNSPNSLDARGWKRSRIRMKERQDDPGIILDGDFEAVSDRVENSRRMRNPYPDDDGTPAFIDVFGNERHLTPGLYDILSPITNEVRVAAVEDIQSLAHTDPGAHAVYDHYVPRDYIIGRAAIVFFWPPRILR
jgi:signal peptidase I